MSGLASNKDRCVVPNAKPPTGIDRGGLRNESCGLLPSVNFKHRIRKIIVGTLCDSKLDLGGVDSCST